MDGPTPFDEALAQASRRLAAARDDHGRAAASRELGWLHFNRHQALAPEQGLPDLARALAFLGGSAHDPAALPEPLRPLTGPAARPDAQADTARALLRAAQRDDDPHLLDVGIALLDSAVSAGGADAGRLTLLAVVRHQRYLRDHDRVDLDQAIEVGERAVAAYREDDPDHAVGLSNLAVAYRARYEVTGVLDDLRRAVDLGERVAADVPDGDPNRLAYLSNLAIAYVSRYDRTDDPADLRRGIALGERVVALGSDDHPERASHLATLAATHFRLFERTGRPDVLDTAIECAERALRIKPDLVKPLSDLCVAYRERHQITGSPDDLRRAIELGERALATLPEGHPKRTAPASNLNLAYQRRYVRGGSPADLERAIELGEQALAATPAGHLSRAKYLDNLGVAHLRRYERTGVLGDLRRAIELTGQALEALPEGHPARVNPQCNAGIGYRALYERTGDPADLERAIELGEQSLAGTPGGHPDRAVTLSHLGLSYRRRYERTGEPADLDRAIGFGERALAALPADHFARPLYLGNLHVAHQRRYEHTGAPADSRRGTRLQRQALEALPDDHPDLAAHLANLAEAYRSRFHRDRWLPRRKELRALAERVRRNTTASPGARVRAHHVVGWLANARGEHDLAVALLDTAAALLPSIPPREAGWSDQEHQLGRHSGLAAEGIAAHCAVDDPVGAVRTAELSRGVLLAAQLDSRTDLTDLRQAHPARADRFERIRARLAEPEIRAGTRRELWEAHDALLADIRRLRGFERFLLPPRLAELTPAAAGGAVVMVNAGGHRGDAVVVTAEADPVLVRLRHLFPHDVTSRAEALLDAAADTGLTAVLRRRRVVREILGWLWDVVVEPILPALPARRVWWMPTGALGLFPLHAAGHPGLPGALDAVVSSYTPTLRALAHTRARPPAPERRQLTVALRHTPGLPELPGTAAEAAAHPGAVLLADRRATAERVLAALPGATWAHFACHATADSATPSRSGLRLHDGPLPLPAISSLRLDHAELAYLSACSTAHRAIRHADESVNLASAFQLAGFRHVIASLWPLSDDVAATAARELYRNLPDGPTADHAATALHRVTRALRDEHPDRPDLWAPLVHSGA